MRAKTRVLIVEDDETLRRLLSMSLQFAGFDVQEAADGLQALKLVDINPPDLIVLDLVLPGIDGLAVRAQLAGDAHTRTIPVVILTGSSLDLRNIDSACILRKPIHPHDVVRAVEKCLRVGSSTAGL